MMIWAGTSATSRPASSTATLTSSAGACSSVSDKYEAEVCRPAQRDGSEERIFTMRITPYRTVDHEIAGVSLTFNDITELKVALDKRADSEESLRLALRASSLGFWRWDVQTDNVSFDARRPRDSQPVPTRPIIDDGIKRIHRDDRPEVERRLEKALDPSGDGRYQCEFRYHPRTRHHPLDTRLRHHPLQRRGGRPPARSSTSASWSMSPRNTKPSARLQESETRLRQSLIEIETIYDNADVGLAVVDRDLRFRRINRRLAEINGVPVEETLGRTLGEVLPTLIDTLMPLYRKVLDGGEAV